MKAKRGRIKRKTLLQKRRVHHLSEEHRKAISRGLKRYHKRQREEIEVPQGFKTGKDEIEPMLNRALRIMMRDHGVDGDIRREINADMTVDWELRFAIPRGTDLDAFTTDLSNVLKPGDNAWIAVGARFASDKNMSPEKKAEYDRFRSMLQVHAHYQRMTKRKIATNVLGIQSIMESMRKNRRRKPEQIFVRVHWNLKGEKPQ